MSSNLAKVTAQSFEPPPPPPRFIEVNILPDQNSYWVSEIADNIDKSRQAFVACKPEFCQEKLYVKDNETERVYEIDWGRNAMAPNSGVNLDK